MGQRQNQDEIVYGNDCLIGWDPGKTPKYVYARFSQLIKCPDNPPSIFHTPPNDRVFKLTQESDSPCRFEYTSSTWLVAFILTTSPLRTTLVLTHAVQFHAYFVDQPTPIKGEGYVFHNQYVTCPGFRGAKGGIAIVTWRLETLQLMNALNIGTGDDLFMEMRPLDDGKKVYKYCKLKDATNIKILYEPT